MLGVADGRAEEGEGVKGSLDAARRYVTMNDCAICEVQGLR